MILEQVKRHPERKDLFINKILTRHEDVQETDKRKVKKILLKILKN